MIILYVSGWFFLGLACVMLELMVPGFFFCLSLALATVPAAISAWYDYALVMQLVVFGASALSFFFIVYCFAGTTAQKDVHYKSGIDALPGKKGFVIQKMYHNHVGQVQVEGQIWSAQAVCQEALEEGVSVTVVRVEGVRLIVKAENRVKE